MLTIGKNHPRTVKFNINNTDLQMEVDMEVTVSNTSKKTNKRQWHLAPLLKFSNTILKTYAVEQIKVLGCIVVNVTYQKLKRKFHC